MTHLCMLLLGALWFLASYQVPTSNSLPTFAQVAALEESGVDLSKLFATYRCYRLMGRHEEARNSSKNIKAVMEKGGSALVLWRQSVATIAQLGPSEPMDAERKMKNPACRAESPTAF